MYILIFAFFDSRREDNMFQSGENIKNKTVPFKTTENLFRHKCDRREVPNNTISEYCSEYCKRFSAFTTVIRKKYEIWQINTTL
jgi:hypothetical protein